MNAFYIICGLGVASLIAEVINLRKGLILLMIVGIATAAALISLDWNTAIHYYSDMMVFDNVAIAFTTLICVIAILWLWMSSDSLIEDERHETDKIALVLFTIAGAVILTAFNNMAMLFLGIEILSISLYILAGGKKENLFSNEASFKYFLMGSFATGFLLMGIALVYGSTQSFNLTEISTYTSAHGNELPGFFYIGVLMMFVGMAFKISAVPFHFWAPDVYEGAPTSITAFMSTIVKVAAFAAFFKIFPVAFGAVSSTWLLPLQIIAVLTLLIANVTAVYQQSVKRMLAFSSVGHAGYTLLAIIGGGVSAASTMFYYLAVYSVASIAAFGVVMIIEKSEGSSDVQSFSGLFKRSPLLAVAMTIALLSLAGIPPLAGFFGKYLVFALALNNGFLWLVIVGVITSLIGVYYYFKVIIAMFFNESKGTSIELSVTQKLLIYLLMLLSIGFGVLPDALHLL
jgi:NADH-quinone oxidoreductase subunit N